MSIFGSAIALDIRTTTIVFILVLLLFLGFEGVLEVVEHACHHHKLDGLVKKLYKEFMIMGLVSFAIFLVSETNQLIHSEFFLAFEFAHIVALFIGIAFILQSSLFVVLIFARNEDLRHFDNNSTEDLLVKLMELPEKGGTLINYLFDYGPVTLHLPRIREKVEYKIIQSFFIRCTENVHHFSHRGAASELVVRVLHGRAELHSCDCRGP
jgi:hypothetical protein